MTVLVDVVNFNADASCLECERWIGALEGGSGSEFCSWLQLYIAQRKKMVLGLTGATIADLHAHNPEALQLVRANSALFEVVVRPFSHDAALVRGRKGFELNLRLGIEAMSLGIGASSKVYLPPEFMLSNEQVAVLEACGIEAVFLNPSRFSHEIQERLPNKPYRVRGVNGASLGCIPMLGDATKHYLDSLHRFDSSVWNAFFVQSVHDAAVTWRDGESPFLIPDGIAREQAWLAGEQGVERKLLREVMLAPRSGVSLKTHHLRAYPVHSFQAWMKEFRMMGYLERVQRLDNSVADFTLLEQALWLQAINSDVLSAVEKRSPVVKLRESASSADETSFTIWRSERGFEGETYLHALDSLREGDPSPAERLLIGDDAFSAKFRGRMDFLQEMAAHA